MTTLTRRYHFSASHRLDSPALTPVENARIFGKCNNPFGHGHNYILEVTVSGPVDPVSGLLVSIASLDRLASVEVLRLFSHRNLNADVAQFRDLIPTTENVALIIAAILEKQWPSYLPPTNTARLERIHVQETDRNGFEVLLARDPAVSKRLTETVAVHA